MPKENIGIYISNLVGVSIKNEIIIKIRCRGNICAEFKSQEAAIMLDTETTSIFECSDF